jgi:glycosyltransferase involved in cell wall biosynthesis
VFNGEKHLAATLQSIAAQTRRPDRLIVLDNCSTDGTRRVVEQFTALPCEWRQNETNLGLFGNLNRALEFASATRYLHLLHADDAIKPAFYRRSIEWLEKVPERSLAYCQPEFMDDSDQPVSGPQVLAGDTREMAAQEFIVQRAELRPIYFPGILLKTDTQPAPVTFRMDMPQLADQLFWAEWAAHCSRVVAIPESLCRYRVHTGSDTHRNKSSLQSWVLDEWRVMELARLLTKTTGFSAWLQQQKQRCIFAARSRVKIKLVRGNAPDFAEAIGAATREITGPVCWLAGGLAAALRPASC